MATPQEVVSEIGSELTDLADRTQRNPGSTVFLAFVRWHEAAHYKLAYHVSLREADRFIGLWDKLSAIALEDNFESIVAQYAAFFDSLQQAIARNPEAFGQAAIAQERASRPETRAFPPSALELPDKVPVAWLAKHVSSRVWTGLVIALLFAFGLGLATAWRLASRH